MADDWQLFPASDTYPGSDVYPGVWPTLTLVDSAASSNTNATIAAPTFTRVQAVSNHGEDSSAPTCTLAAATAGNLLVASFSAAQISGSRSLTGVTSGWTQVPTDGDKQGGGSNCHQWVYYKIAAGGETVVAGTLSSAAADWTMCVAEYNTTTGVWALGVHSSNSGSSTTADSGSAATNVPTAVWLGFLTAKQNAMSSPTNSFTEAVQVISTNATATHVVDSVIYQKFVTATGTANVSATISTSRSWAGCIASFYPGAAPSTYNITFAASATATPTLVQTAAQTLRASVTATSRLAKGLPLATFTSTATASASFARSAEVLTRSFSVTVHAGSTLTRTLRVTKSVAFNATAHPTATMKKTVPRSLTVGTHASTTFTYFAPTVDTESFQTAVMGTPTVTANYGQHLSTSVHAAAGLTYTAPAHVSVGFTTTVSATASVADTVPQAFTASVHSFSELTYASSLVFNDLRVATATTDASLSYVTHGDFDLTPDPAETFTITAKPGGSFTLDPKPPDSPFILPPD